MESSRVSIQINQIINKPIEESTFTHRAIILVKNKISNPPEKSPPTTIPSRTILVQNTTTSNLSEPSLPTTTTTTPAPGPTMATPTNPLAFYDIAHRPPVEATCCSPNPSKTRLALNLKRVPHKTTWVPMPDIAAVRTQLGVPPCRQFADGSDFHTLPVVVDPSTTPPTALGDSFDIAAHLQHAYPDSGDGDLFPPGAQLDFALAPGSTAAMLVPLTPVRESAFPAYARFNVDVDAAFTAHVQLCVQGIPFDPATADASRAEFVRRAGVGAWEDFALEGAARDKVVSSFEETLGPLAGLFEGAGGPFLLGERACYADCVVGGWLRMMAVTLPRGEWEMLRRWHGGVFGRLHDALEVYAEVK
ncbi:hypothetical protein SLS55_007668 [Diplodia seriata]|uniref:GST N-terminal domain-containing protein n=1 Tax=Diplodia seriata TaxID=420778 RepID=A0ABR3C899_9PEZI